MINEKQQKILQMAKDICRVKLNCNDVCKPISACDALKYAERAVEAGYSKQEWISVDERLPENGTERVMVFLRDNPVTATIGINKIDTDRYLDGKWVRWGKYVTYWMPLPEAPKGGDHK